MTDTTRPATHHHSPDDSNPRETSVRGGQTGGHTPVLQNASISMNREIGIGVSRSYFISKENLNYVCCGYFGDAEESDNVN